MKLSNADAAPRSIECPEAVLWGAVIEQMFSDALCRVDSPNDVLTARRWLLYGGEDFDLVCEFAGISASAVRAKARTFREKGWGDCT